MIDREIKPQQTLECALREKVIRMLPQFHQCWTSALADGGRACFFTQAEL